MILKFINNNRMKIRIIIIALLLQSGISFLYSQNNYIDQVVGVVGNKSILMSDIENQYSQYILQGYKKGDSSLKCMLLEDMLFQKLLLNQAEIDSVTVSETQVEADLTRRIKYFSKQIGGDAELEKYYNKSILEIKEDFRTLIKNQLLQQTMENKITENVKITPSEVNVFFKTMPKDSIPTISSVLEIAQIVKNPVVSEAEKQKSKDKLTAIRERILKGEDFATLAVLYSEDIGTASKGGELGFTERGDLDPVFEAAAYKLKEGEISPVVLSKFGYHIIKLIERRGESINVRHILIQSKVATEDLLKAKLSLDSIYEKIMSDSITFEIAALKYSDDPTGVNGGLLINTEAGTSKFQPEQLEASLFFVVDKLKVGEISKPVPMTTDEGKQAYRIIYLKSRTEPHVANLKEDYDFIQTAALSKKKIKVIEEWIQKKAAKTYIRIDESYKKCKFTYQWQNL